MKICRKHIRIFLVFSLLLFNEYYLLIPRQAYAGASSMMVYDTEDVTSIPKYRLWNGSWGSEGTANGVHGEIRQMNVKYAPTRDEAIMVVQTSTGEIQAQVFDGTSWSTPEVLGTHHDNLGSTDTQSLYRGFDLEYEQSTGDAMVVYGNGTKNPEYRTWNGSVWSDPTVMSVPTSVMPNWIELASRPGSDDLAMILVDGSADVYGERWSSNAWDDMGVTTVWDTAATIATKKCIDVSFETTTGDIMFLWGTATAADDHHYRAYSGGSLGVMTALANANAGGQPQWIKLARNPTAGSNQIMLGTLDAGADLNTFIWSGAAWSAVHAEHTAATENILDMNFDIEYETHASNPNDAWLVYGAGTTITRKRWDGPTSAWGLVTTSNDNTAQVNLAVQPNSGAVLGILYEDPTSVNDDILQINQTGGVQVWNASTQISAGPVRRNLGCRYFDIAGQAYNASTKAMVVYDTQTLTSIPKYRRWTGDYWDTQGSAQPVQGEIRHMVLKFSPTRNEAILATLGSNGIVQAQVWDGTSWEVPATIASNVADINGIYDSQTLYRAFDLDYEQTSGDAMIVYGDGTPDPDFKVWNGATWSVSGTNIDIPNSITPNWIAMSAHYGSTDDKLAVIVVDGSTDVFGARWDGNNWDMMGQSAVWDATAGTPTRKCVDVAFEKNSGDILYVWGDGTAGTHWNFATYTAGALSAFQTLANGNNGGISQMVKLAANPLSSSNEIMLAGVDAGADLNTVRWNGAAWSAVDAEHTAGVEDILDTNFDLIYETYSGNPNMAWLVYGAGTTFTRKRWNSAAWDNSTTAGQDTAQIKLVVQSGTGSISTLAYKDDTSALDDAQVANITTNGGTAWSAQSSIWSGPVRRNLGLSLIDAASQNYYVDFVQNDFKWYADEDTVTLTNPWPIGLGDDLAENSWITQIPGSNEPLREGDRIRVQINFSTTRLDLGANATSFKLQYAAGEDCTTAAGWTEVGAKDSAVMWRFYDNPSLADNETQVNQISTSTAGAEGLYSEVNPTLSNPNLIRKDLADISEWDWAIESNDATPNTTFCFRMVEGDNVKFSTYNSDGYPKLTTSPGPGSMMRHGNFFQNLIQRGFLWAN